ncbi:MAG TPA: NAD(P)H-binding protein [Steroidobacteraceae bacterium]|jgi:NAD(P)H dehydrogenase (quinone)|nr:NAD(P)H-binding protein [Steroidobacteraceae bacterium]
MRTQTLLVIGATGKTGRYTVQHLLKGSHAVRAMVHKEDERSEVLRRSGAEVVIGELLDHDDVIRAAAGTSAAYFCYPIVPGLIQATTNFADAAKRVGLKAVVNMSQISAREDSKSHAARDHWIAERIFDWSGVSTIHLRPTFFSEWLLLPFLRSSILEKGIIDLPFGNGRHAPIAGEDQARLIATILAAPAAHVGKTYTLCGPTELDQAGIAAAITEVLGRKISYLPQTIPQYRERLEKAGLREFTVQHLCAVALDYQNGLFSGEDKVIAELTGKPPMTVQNFVASHREAFKTASAAD